MFFFEAGHDSPFLVRRSVETAIFDWHVLENVVCRMLSRPSILEGGIEWDSPVEFEDR